jgi:predicted RNA-binding Zn-ribbon protein involved in translation (DUF1610 family)
MAWYARHKIKCDRCGVYLRVVQILSWNYNPETGIAKVKVVYVCPKCGKVTITETLL